MATTVLKAGAQIDVLTPADMKHHTDRLVHELSRIARDPVVLRRGPREVITTDAGGNLGGGAQGPGIELYRCPVGTFAQLQRFSLSAPPGASGSPGTALTTGWVALYVSTPASDALVNFTPQGPAGSVVLPFMFEEGDGAVKIQNGESLLLVGAGLPASSTYGCLTQVRLWPQSWPVAVTTVEE